MHSRSLGRSVSQLVFTSACLIILSRRNEAVVARPAAC